MASPQLENGHLRIAYEVWEHVCRQDLNGAEFRVVGCILRHSWGWKRKECELSISTIAEWCDLSERAVSKAAASLEARNMVKATRGSGRGNLTKWTFNKDWESWKRTNNCSPLKKDEQLFMDEQTGSQRVNNDSSFSTQSFTLSPDKPLIPEGQQPRKTILKESKRNIGAKAPRRKDSAAETWCSEFAEHRGIPYRAETKDYVHLAGLRKTLGCNNGDAPGEWTQAIHNYFLTPQSSYTLADLCCRFDVFRLSALDRYQKPVVRNPEITVGTPNETPTKNICEGCAHDGAQACEQCFYCECGSNYKQAGRK